MNKRICWAVFYSCCLVISIVSSLMLVLLPQKAIAQGMLTPPQKATVVDESILSQKAVVQDAPTLSPKASAHDVSTLSQKAIAHAASLLQNSRGSRSSGGSNTVTSQDSTYTDHFPRHELVYDLAQGQTYYNNGNITLDPPPTVVEGNVYMPLKFLAHFFDMELVYNSETHIAELAGEQLHIRFDMKSERIDTPSGQLNSSGIAFVMNERIMVQLAWLSEQLAADYESLTDEHKIVVRYQAAQELDDTPLYNAKPVAKFVVDKQAYARGESITYTNLSYDPDADAISLSWSGRQDAFFTAGEHEVSLVAIDQNGNSSEPYTLRISVTEQTIFSALEHGIYTNKPGGYTVADDQQFNESLLQLPEISKKQRSVEKRKLLVSDSPENIVASGILYQDDIEGKARLYANHLNATDENIVLAILATNQTNKSITLKTSRQGEAMPSKYAMLVGSEAAIDFLSVQAADEEQGQVLTVAPGETVVYRQLPALMPQYSINAMYDVEASGKLLLSFVAVNEQAAGHSSLDSQLLKLPKLAFDGHVRGSFPQSSIVWDVYPRKHSKKTIQRLMIGDGKSDAFIEGYDAQRASQAVLYGNYGVEYEITIHKPGNMAVLMMARGGSFKGAFKVDGQFVRVPASGTVEPLQGFVTIAKTTADQKQTTIQFIPPAGSSFPIMLVFYPLDERVKLLHEQR